MSGSGPRSIAKRFKDQQMVIAEPREGSIYKELKRVVPTVTALGGAILGLLSVVGDLMGAIGNEHGILKLNIGRPTGDLDLNLQV